MEVYFDTRIFYLIHKTRVENLYTAWDFLRGDVFVGDDSFLGRDDRLKSFFFEECGTRCLYWGAYTRSTCSGGIYLGMLALGLVFVPEMLESEILVLLVPKILESKMLILPKVLMSSVLVLVIFVA